MKLCLSSTHIVIFSICHRKGYLLVLLQLIPLPLYSFAKFTSIFLSHISLLESRNNSSDWWHLSKAKRYTSRNDDINSQGDSPMSPLGKAQSALFLRPEGGVTSCYVEIHFDIPLGTNGPFSDRRELLLLGKKEAWWLIFINTKVKLEKLRNSSSHWSVTFLKVNHGTNGFL